MPSFLPHDVVPQTSSQSFFVLMDANWSSSADSEASLLVPANKSTCAFYFAFEQVKRN